MTALGAPSRRERLSAILVPLGAYVVLGIALPLAVLMWLLAHHEPPYVLDRASTARAAEALGGAPVSLRAGEGVFDLVAGDAVTARYADGSTSTFFHAARPEQAIAKYGSSLQERRMTSFSIGGFTRRDATLADGRVARTFGLDGVVFAFVAPSVRRLDRLVAQSALRANPRRDIGNAVLDDRKPEALAVGFGWFAFASTLAVLAVLRALRASEQAASAF